MTDYKTRRERMVREQIGLRGIDNKRVLAAMRAVPRELFVPEKLRHDAYADGPLPIGVGQTVSQPFVVALMAELAEPQPGQKVLDVGAGSGYAAAVMAQIVSHVYAIERHAELTERAQAAFDALGYTNITTRTGDGTRGWAKAAPFDAILVAAAGKVPQALLDQLKVGGHLVMPVQGEGKRQVLKRMTRTGETEWEERSAGGVAFVPLVPGP